MHFACWIWFNIGKKQTKKYSNNNKNNKKLNKKELFLAAFLLFFLRPHTLPKKEMYSSRVLALFPDDVPRYRGGEDGSILNGAIYSGQSVPKPHHPHCEKFSFF